jgi:hypothetical protein
VPSHGSWRHVLPSTPEPGISASQPAKRQFNWHARDPSRMGMHIPILAEESFPFIWGHPEEGTSLTSPPHSGLEKVGL